MLCTKHTPEIGFANRVLACLCAIALQPCGREFPLTSANPYIFPIPSFSTWFIRLAQRISSPPSIHVSVSSPRSIKFYRFISSRLLSRQQHQTPIKHQASLLKSLCSPASLAHSLRSTCYVQLATTLHYTTLTRSSRPRALPQERFTPRASTEGWWPWLWGVGAEHRLVGQAQHISLVCRSQIAFSRNPLCLHLRL